MIAGVDYGSKTAGTTVLALSSGRKILLYQSEKKKDADQFLSGHILAGDIRLVALDAPLSIPGKLAGIHGKTDYFYRDCDRALKAMSPMFIGGLTARAIKLRDLLDQHNVKVIEAYPKAIASTFDFYDYYQKKNNSLLPDFVKGLQSEFPDFELPKISNWHQADAVLAFLIGWKYSKGLHSEVGDASEGTICY